MKIGNFVAGIVLAAGALPASAQDVPSDLRCLLISNMFGKSKGDDRGKPIAARSTHFFAGRLDARGNAQTITAAMRTESAKIDPKTAGAEMNACAARMVRGSQAIQAMAQSAMNVR